LRGEAKDPEREREREREREDLLECECGWRVEVKTIDYSFFVT
jgi:hypothetical protein